MKTEVKTTTPTIFAGKAAGTILLAMAFLALVMFLSYLFIHGTMK